MLNPMKIYPSRLVLLVIATIYLYACSSSTPTPTPAENTPESVQPTVQPTVQATLPTSESGRQITVSNAANLRQVFLVPVSKTTLLATSVSPINHDIATFGFDKVVRIFDGDTGDLKKEMYGNSEYSQGLQYSPDGTEIASGGAFYVWLWDAASGRKIAATQINAKVERLVWSPDGKIVAVVGQRSAAIQVLDGQTGRAANELFNPTNYVMLAIGYAPDGNLIIVGDGRGRVTVFDPHTNQVVFDDHSRPRGAVSDVEFSRDGRYIASCHAGTGDIEIWETQNWGQVVSLEEAHKGKGGCLDGTFSADGEVYFSVGFDGKFNAWEVKTGHLLNSIQEAQAVWNVNLSGDGEILALAVDTGRMGIIGLP